jgi:AcrR family transcriptional regulator
VPTARAKRSDAVRNRERVVAAAAAVFAKRGIDATVPEIAAAAGVGKATVYRSFPTKDHLVAAIADERLNQLAARCDVVAASEDAAAGLRDILRDTARRQATDCLLAGALSAAAELPEMIRAREAVDSALGRVVDAAKAQGAIREDVTAEDIRVLFAGVSRVLVERGEHDPAAWERYAELISAALRR